MHVGYQLQIDTMATSQNVRNRDLLGKFTGDQMGGPHVHQLNKKKLKDAYHETIRENTTAIGTDKELTFNGDILINCYIKFFVCKP